MTMYSQCYPSIVAILRDKLGERRFAQNPLRIWWQQHWLYPKPTPRLSMDLVTDNLSQVNPQSAMLVDELLLEDRYWPGVVRDVSV